MTDLCIIILSYNTKDLTLKCIESIFKYPPKAKFEVLIVDNASTDNSVEAIRKQFPKVFVIMNKENLGFTKANNLGLKAVEADSYLLLNSDTEVKKGSIQSLVDFANSSDFGIVSAKLLNSDGSFQPNVGQLPTPLPTLLWLSGIDDLLRLKSLHINSKKLYTDRMEVGWVSGAAMMIKSSVIQKIGYLDEKIFMYGEDMEYCWRAKKSGVRIGWTNNSEIIHIGGASFESPKLNQWLGEFKGLIYLYKKNYGGFPAFILEIMIELFVFLRVIGYLIKGKVSFAKNYVTVIQNI